MALRFATVALILAIVAPVVSCDSPFSVEFKVETTKGEDSFIVDVHPDWAPIGAARFKELVEAQFYDDIRFFRVIPGFMAQFGIPGDPALAAEWRSKTINDEPVKESNKRGYITFAKTGAPNSRTFQLFINYSNNANLDGMGFAPFGKVRDGGMSVVDAIYPIQERPNQGQIQSEGNAYLDSKFPECSKLISVRVVEGHSEL
mmetsp:Transcript_13148/g.15934  ORF Transcript_13148/g.15934 Transcript_13148/m.15934 type:complete len:202 (-) Transcript_13148:161-766(-)|eukprot:CAMPEP_0197847490 /NCGR_PEP_ID=MMETSP1438-20131217/6343_1 /TAXON_ID=1461541 /ORGANISM="Pterosperma sp., Strain CCMP1384" /LENGTH=201 /DNA_ID=CAMNT_0043459429 /DNA_START=41 /DNA_END=646 /DNA_ORIENTATION=+